MIPSLPKFRNKLSWWLLPIAAPIIIASQRGQARAQSSRNNAAHPDHNVPIQTGTLLDLSETRRMRGTDGEVPFHGTNAWSVQDEEEVVDDML